MKPLLTLLQAALLVTAVCMLGLPELRATPLRYALYALTAASVASTLWRLRQAGLLGLGPREILRHPARSRFSVLDGASAIAAAIALTVTGPP